MDGMALPHGRRVTSNYSSIIRMAWRFDRDTASCQDAIMDNLGLVDIAIDTCKTPECSKDYMMRRRDCMRSWPRA